MNRDYHMRVSLADLYEESLRRYNAYLARRAAEEAETNSRSEGADLQQTGDDIPYRTIILPVGAMEKRVKNEVEKYVASLEEEVEKSEGPISITAAFGLDRDHHSSGPASRCTWDQLYAIVDAQALMIPKFDDGSEITLMVMEDSVA